jgi:hypothetical protein
VKLSRAFFVFFCVAAAMRRNRNDGLIVGFTV